MNLISKVINRLHASQVLGRVFHTLDYCLQKELRDCKTVLDLGCGPSSPIQRCPWIKYSVGVEAFKPYLDKARRAKTHTRFINKRIEEIDFPYNSFDAVIMIEVLEHLAKKRGREILVKAERWAKKKIVVTTPNGYISQPAVDNNPYQRHQSGWTVSDLRHLGFECWGLAGLKFLRKPKEEGDSMVEGDLLVSIKYKPRWFWFVVATLSQLFTYYLPTLGFEIFAVRKLDEGVGDGKKF